jgi:hypothetical protein
MQGFVDSMKPCIFLFVPAIKNDLTANLQVLAVYPRDLEVNPRDSAFNQQDLKANPQVEDAYPRVDKILAHSKYTLSHT